MKPTAVYPEMRGKVFIVTGAASGMGKTLSLQLAAQGANVGLLDLHKPDATAKEIREIHDAGETIALTCDVRDRSAVDSAHKIVFDKWGRLDGAANLAGFGGNQKIGETGYALQNLKDSDWDFMLATNLGGVKNCLRAQFQVMKGPGSIVNAASIAGQKGQPNASPYGSSKWGVIGLTKCAAQESASRGITVNAVAPGAIETPLLLNLGSKELLDSLLTANIAMRRIAKPDEVTRVMLFLLSEDAAYMTGSVVNVDGGWM